VAGLQTRSSSPDLLFVCWGQRIAQNRAVSPSPATPGLHDNASGYCFPRILEPAGSPACLRSFCINFSL